MFENYLKSDWSVETIACVKIRVHDQECTVDVDTWDEACKVLDMINEYTGGKDVYKVQAIKMVREATGSGLREAKLMTKAYFEPTFEHDSEKGWHQYGQQG